MSSTEIGPLPEDQPESFAVIGHYRSAREAHEAGLSILAAGHHYWVHAAEGRFLLIVSGKHGETLQREVEFAERLNRYWPPTSLDLPAPTVSKLPTVFSVAFLVSIFTLQSGYPHLADLGANDSEAVLQRGEWWRLVTAITLHADLGHLAGNLMGISLFAYLCCRYMGNGLAWLLIIAAACLSNLTNVLLNAGSAYRSLGASTAVFSALGILAGFPIGTYLRGKEPMQSRDWLIPFFGSCILFAWMGGGDFPTDVPAHLWSFAYGLAIALAISWTALHAKLGQRQQHILLASTLILVAGSWTWALSA